jgi:hypothetical protein
MGALLLVLSLSVSSYAAGRACPGLLHMVVLDGGFSSEGAKHV